MRTFVAILATGALAFGALAASPAGPAAAATAASAPSQTILKTELPASIPTSEPGVTFESGVLTIGPGTMPDYSWNGAPWHNYRGEVEQIVFSHPEQTALSVIANGLFGYMPKLTTVTGISDVYVGHTTSMFRLFTEASSLTSIDLSGWDVSKVKSFGDMFKDAAALSSIDVSGWDTASATSFEAMFTRAKNLETVDVSNWNLSNVTSTAYMFFGADSLTSIDTSAWQTGNLESSFGMLTGTNLTSVDVSSWDTSKLRTASFMFSNMTKLNSLDVSNWNTTSLTDTGQMFSGTKALSYIDVSRWDTSSLQNTIGMFQNASGLSTLDVSQWNTENLRYARHMFEESAVRELDVSAWNTAKLEQADYMFENMHNITKLDVSAWNLASLIDAPGMFSSMWKLEELDLSGWDLRGVTDQRRMLSSLTSLKVLKLGEHTTLAPDVNLYSPLANAPYTGRWVAVGAGSIDVPRGSWDGEGADVATRSHSGQADTYVWQQTIELRHVPNGGSGDPISVSGVTGYGLTVEKNVFEYLKHKFAGWTAAADGSGSKYKAGDVVFLPGGMTEVYAQWTTDAVPPVKPEVVKPTEPALVNTGSEQLPLFAIGGAAMLSAVGIWLYRRIARGKSA